MNTKPIDIDSIDAEAIREELRELESREAALRVLLRAAVARDRRRRTSPAKAVEASEVSA
jgi:hypothetical protein